MKEIGGYFEIEACTGVEYHTDALRLNTARNCLAYLINARGIKKILLPYYICDSVINVCKKYNCDIKFYHINSKFLPIIEDFDNEYYVYIVNYFGLFSNYQLIKLNRKYKNIIVDNVHSFFQKPIKNIDTIYSCRKFFGTSDGAYLYSNCKKMQCIEPDKSTIERFKYLFGRLEYSASQFYNNYIFNEQQLEKEDIKLMSKTTNNILKGINYKKVKKNRYNNYKYVNKSLRKKNLIKVNNFGLYLYPYYSKNGDKLKKILISKKIYVPTLWPNVLADNNDLSLEYNLANCTVLIPIDQRYNINDMKRIVQIIKENDENE